MAAKPPEPPGAKKQKQKKAELSASAAGEAADENPFEKLSDMLVVEVAVALVGPEADVDSLRCLACVCKRFSDKSLLLFDEGREPRSIVHESARLSVERTISKQEREAIAWITPRGAATRGNASVWREATEVGADEILVADPLERLPFDQLEELSEMRGSSSQFRVVMRRISVFDKHGPSIEHPGRVTFETTLPPDEEGGEDTWGEKTLCSPCDSLDEANELAAHVMRAARGETESKMGENVYVRENGALQSEHAFIGVDGCHTLYARMGEG